MRNTLIVARMKPNAAADVSRIFADSDAGELPHLIGVRERRLYRFHDLYMHYIESDDEVRNSLAEVRDHELFQDINRQLSAHITAYDPQTWRSPDDAMAQEFYTWQANT
ncbi:TcmI family type II polyketide cyclase [Streptomyces sp. NPDC048436]|uniref:TcmI family type II polyketide cyclase n=1 Tax=Streptomyces sp. NPDC048436 TaxID=3365550 RepID=UPI00371B84C4